MARRIDLFQHINKRPWPEIKRPEHLSSEILHFILRKGRRDIGKIMKACLMPVRPILGDFAFFYEIVKKRRAGKGLKIRNTDAVEG